MNNDDGIVFDLECGNSRDRGGHGGNSNAGINMPPEDLCLYRDLDFMDKSNSSKIAEQSRPGVFIFNCWVEAWGSEHRWFPCGPDDNNAPALAVMDGKPADGIMRINSSYEPDGFWWDSQLRITPGFPAGEHFLEPYAHAVAELDACRITRGGLFLDKAHSGQIRSFSLAYQALPRKKFATIGKTGDPVAVRTQVDEGQRYLYLVNRDHTAVAVELRFSTSTGCLRNLATGDKIEWRDGALVLVLGAYELKSFVLDEKEAVVDFAVKIPEETLAQLQQDTDALLACFVEVRKADRFVAGMDSLETGIKRAVVSHEIAWLRRALNCYISRKCRALTRRS